MLMLTTNRNDHKLIIKIFIVVNIFAVTAIHEVSDNREGAIHELSDNAEGAIHELSDNAEGAIHESPR
jgi:hypothetical protein